MSPCPLRKLIIQDYFSRICYITLMIFCDPPGKPLQDYTYKDLIKLRRTQLMELFSGLYAPAMTEMHGEYRAVLLGSGHVNKNCHA